MKILLTAINAKYIHSNLAVYSLRAYAKKLGHEIDLAEFTINQHVDDILEKIYMQQPDVLLFSCYIWNISYVKELAWEYHKICPQVPIWAGGPEVSFETETFLKENPAIDGVMMGEGERTLSALADWFEKTIPDRQQEASAFEEEQPGEVLPVFPSKEIERISQPQPQTMTKTVKTDVPEEIDGISYRKPDGTIEVRPLRRLLDMDEIPFCYGDLSGLQHRIIYYESSRGCPFSCSYCLSSVDKQLRFRSLPNVYRELQFFLDAKVPQVKFVDRTFNCRHDHALGIWRYIKAHDNGITNFHFEVSADLLNEEELELMADMRPGLIQLEIGVQSTHPETIREIHRTMRLPQVYEAVRKVQQGKNIHQHLDLIAGLPYEDYETFQQSFDEIYALHPDQLQLGFLKVLKGSYMYQHTEEYGLVYRTRPPYEVLATKWLPYEKLCQIRLVEEMLELHYNSGLFLTTLSVLEGRFESAFSMFQEMGNFYQTHGYLECSHSRVRRTEIVMEFAESVDPGRRDIYREALLFDLYKPEKAKSRPKWAKELPKEQKQMEKQLRGMGAERKYCHLEPFCFFDENGKFHEKTQPVWLLFDYEHRDALANEAAVSVIEKDIQSGTP